MMFSLVKSPIRLTLSWTAATAIGYLLGGLVILGLSSTFFGGYAFFDMDMAAIESRSANLVEMLGYLALIGVAFGLTVSLCQWVLLRQIEETAVQWLVVSGLGTALAFVLTTLSCLLLITTSSSLRLGCQGPSFTYASPLEFNPFLTGALVGAVQWLYLRRWLPLAWLWIPASAISGSLLEMMYTLSFGAVMSIVCAVGISFFFAVPALVTAVLLGWLWSKSEESSPEVETLAEISV